MLAYAFRSLREITYDQVKAESFDNIHNLFAAILSRAIGQQLKRGLYRNYRKHQDDLPVVRGKINLTETIKQRSQGRLLVNCEYDELTENNLLNQILKETMLLLLKQDSVDRKYKVIFKRELLLFAKVERIDLQHVQWTKLKFNRINQTYQMLMAICQLIVQGMLLTNEAGEYYLADFLDDQKMAKLFEKFVLNYYEQEFASRYSEFTSRASQIPWGLDDDNSEMLPMMQTDVTLTFNNRILIIDTKYYQQALQYNYGAITVNSPNLYQIFTYVKNKEAQLAGKEHQISGMLLYAKTDEEYFRDNVYHMQGNRIAVKALDLNQDFKKITRQLDQIVWDHFGIKKVSGK